MTPQLTIPMWLGLSIETRLTLRTLFNIPRSEGSHVQDNEIISDGTNHHDLALLTVEKMQAHLNSKEKDFFKLFDAVLESIKPVPVVTPEPVNEVKVADAEPITKPKRKYERKTQK